MNLEKLQKRLIEAARANPPADTVPFAFEKRIMANLKAKTMIDQWSAWGLALWRAVTPYIVLMLFFCAWSLISARINSVEPLDMALENTLYEPFNASVESW